MASGEVILHGRSIAPGIGIGIAWVEELPGEIPRYRISKSSVEKEQNRFRHALHIVKNNVKHHIELTHGLLDDELNQVLRAHEMMVQDREVAGRIENNISRNLKSAEWVVSEEIKKLTARFEDMRDPYLQARAEDVRDFGLSILKALSKEQDVNKTEGNKSSSQTMITRNLFPSLAMRAHRKGIVGFATESAAVFSHAAIILKGLGIPVVGNTKNLIDSVHEGNEIIIDGINGLVIVRPEETTREKYLRLRQDFEQQPSVEEYEPILSYTRNGVPVKLMANIEHPNQTSHLLRCGLEGIGLFRTEFLALERGFVPSEDEQFLVYRNLIESTKGISVVIRTFDIGADKSTAGLHRCVGMNPALGIRGIRRHLLREPEELRFQIKAILRASVDAEVAVLFPMITDLNDIKKLKEHMLAAKEELKREKKPFAEHVRVGAMVVVPSAAILTTEILELVDFISIGTNDLLQYFTGADRDNPEVLSYHDPGGSAFSWLLKYIIAEARGINREKDVNICGEIAGDVEIVPMLLKIGFRSLSISPAYAENIRSCISKTLVNEN